MSTESPIEVSILVSSKGAGIGLVGSMEALRKLPAILDKRRKSNG